jgi:hypothetical protein
LRPLGLLASIAVISTLGSFRAASDDSLRKPELAKNVIPVRVDERIELLSIIFRLIKADEYHQTPATVPYAKEVDAHFGKFKDHEAARMASRLRRNRGIGFDAVPWFALHLAVGPRLAPRIPFDQVIDWEKRWSPESAPDFLAAVQKFADDSKAFEFMNEHREFYAKSADRLSRLIAKRPYRGWLDEFFGAKPGTEFCAIVGLLNGSSNYGSKVRFPDGHEEILPVIGAANFDSSGLPLFDDASAGTVAHEFCHSYCNPLVDRCAARLLPAADKIFPRRADLLNQQAYSDARIMLYESLVRACTHRFLCAHGTTREADAEAQKDVRRGFYWITDLSALLHQYEVSRRDYPTLEAFMPRIEKFFEQQAASVDERLARLPHITRLVPANGATDVDPKLTELRIEFDRPMNEKSYALMGRTADMPKMPGGSRFENDGKTFVQSIRLEPGKKYRLTANSIWRGGFTSADGLPLDPVEITFTTAKQ